MFLKVWMVLRVRPRPGMVVLLNYVIVSLISILSFSLCFLQVFRLRLLRAVREFGVRMMRGTGVFQFCVVCVRILTVLICQGGGQLLILPRCVCRSCGSVGPRLLTCKVI